jgi:hypothetical protein
MKGYFPLLRLLAFAIQAALIAAVPAWADMYPDGSNAVLPATGTPNAAVCQVSGGKLAALAAGCIAAPACVNIMGYGGVADGSGDNGVALSAALAASPANQKCVAFPPGKFKFTSTFVYSYPTGNIVSVSLVGAGRDVTQLIGPTASSLLSFTLTQQMQSFHLTDLSLIADNPCSTCTALGLTQSGTLTAEGYSGASDITRVSITGSDRSAAFPSGSNYWLTGVDLNGTSNVNFDGVYIEGIQNASGPTPGTSRGVYIHGDAAHIPVQLNFSNSIINLYSIGLDYGDYVQGVQWVNGNMVGDKIGFNVSTTSGHQSGQLSIANSQINACSGIYVPAVPSGSDPRLDGLLVSNTSFINTGQRWSCGSYTTAVYVANATPYTMISNNNFSGRSAFTGISIWGPSYVSGHVNGNMINGFGVGIDTTPAPGISTFGTLIDGNTITNNGVGIQLGLNTIDAVVSNNLMQGNTTDLVSNEDVFRNSVDIPQGCITPVFLSFNGATTGMVYNVRECRIVSVGRQVFIDFDYGLSNKGTATGALRIELPVAISSIEPQGIVSVAYAVGFAGLSGSMTGNIDAGATHVSVYQWGPTAAVPVTDTNVAPSGMRLQGRVEYPFPLTQALMK